MSTASTASCSCLPSTESESLDTDDIVALTSGMFEHWVKHTLELHEEFLGSDRESRHHDPLRSGLQKAARRNAWNGPPNESGSTWSPRRLPGAIRPAWTALSPVHRSRRHLGPPDAEHHRPQALFGDDRACGRAFVTDLLDGRGRRPCPDRRCARGACWLLFGAAHETTASALTWTILSMGPAPEGRFRPRRRGR